MCLNSEVHEHKRSNPFKSFTSDVYISMLTGCLRNLNTPTSHQLLVSVILTMVVVITTVLRLFTTTHALAILDTPCNKIDTPVLVRWLSYVKCGQFKKKDFQSKGNFVLLITIFNHHYHIY